MHLPISSAPPNPRRGSGKSSKPPPGRRCRYCSVSPSQRTHVIIKCFFIYFFQLGRVPCFIEYTVCVGTAGTVQIVLGYCNLSCPTMASQTVFFSPDLFFLYFIKFPTGSFNYWLIFGFTISYVFSLFFHSRFFILKEHVCLHACIKAGLSEDKERARRVDFFFNIHTCSRLQSYLCRRFDPLSLSISWLTWSEQIFYPQYESFSSGR